MRGNFRRARRRRQHEADARLEQVHGEQADHQRDGGDRLEVDHRAEAHAADDLHVTGARDARHQRAEDQRRDDHLDQPEKQLAERAEERCPVGMGPADQRAGRDADDRGRG